MIKNVFILTLSLILFSCSDSEDQQQEKVKSVEEPEVSVVLEDLIGDWNIAVEKEDGWYKVEGADEYGLHIAKQSDEAATTITMSDRMGLSVDLYVEVQEFADLGGGGFELGIKDLQMEQYYEWAGVYWKEHSDWNCRVIDLEGEFAEMVSWEAGDGVSAVRLYENSCNSSVLTGVLEWVEEDVDSELGY